MPSFVTGLPKNVETFNYKSTDELVEVTSRKIHRSANCYYGCTVAICSLIGLTAMNYLSQAWGLRMATGLLLPFALSQINMTLQRGNFELISKFARTRIQPKE